MPVNTLVLPFDPNGSAATNYIEGEQHIISPPVSSPFYFVVPFNGPFFEHDLEITRYPSGQPLIKGVDYQLAWKFVSATRATARPVYSAISLMNTNLSGVLSLKIRYLGGDWQIDQTRAAELLLHNHVNPRITAWEQVQELPYAFPVINHEWHLNDMVGASEVVDAIDRIVAAIMQTGEASIDNHLVNFNNPHQVTAQQVGAVPVSEFVTMLESYLTANAVPNSVRLGGMTLAEVLSAATGGFMRVVNLNNPFGIGYSHINTVSLLGHNHEVFFIVSTLGVDGKTAVDLLVAGNQVGARLKHHTLYGVSDTNYGYVYDDVSGEMDIWVRVNEPEKRITFNLMAGHEYNTNVPNPGVVGDAPSAWNAAEYSSAAINMAVPPGSTGELRTVSEIRTLSDLSDEHDIFHTHGTMDVTATIRMLTPTNNLVHTHYEAISPTHVRVTTSEPVAIRVILTYYIGAPEVPVAPDPIPDPDPTPDPDPVPVPSAGDYHLVTFVSGDRFAIYDAGSQSAIPGTMPVPASSGGMWGGPTIVAYDPTRRRIAFARVVSSAHQIDLYDLDTGTHIDTLSLPGEIRSIRYNDDYSLIIVTHAHGGFYTVFNTDTLTPISGLPTLTGTGWSGGWSSDHDTSRVHDLAIGYQGNWGSGTGAAFIVMDDNNTGGLSVGDMWLYTPTPSQSEAAVSSVRFIPGTNTAAVMYSVSVNAPENIHIVDLDTREAIFKTSPPDRWTMSQQMEVTSDGRYLIILASINTGHALYVYDRIDDVWLPVIPVENINGTAGGGQKFDLSTDGSYISFAGMFAISTQTWDVIPHPDLPSVVGGFTGTPLGIEIIPADTSIGSLPVNIT